MIHSLFDSSWEIIKLCLLPLVHFGFYLIVTLQHFVNLLPYDLGTEEANALNSNLPTDCSVHLAIHRSFQTLHLQIYTSLDHWGTLKGNNSSPHEVRAEVCWTVLTLSPYFFSVESCMVYHWNTYWISMSKCGKIEGACVAVFFFVRLCVELKDDCNTLSNYIY